MTKLRLNPNKLSPEKKADVENLKKLNKKPHLDVPLTLEDIQKTEKWLCKTFPLLFSKKRSKPLKVGLDKDIFEEVGDKLPMSRSLVRKSIGYYVNHPLYLKGLLEGNVRYDLKGQESGVVDQTHKDNAQEILNKRKEKKNE